MRFLLSEEALIFDIKEFAVNDGPGARVTVFLKGCPLRCMWCHNPEGIRYENELNLATNLMYAKKYTSDELVQYLMKFQKLYELSGGGVTFSGGEATSHHLFLISTLKRLKSNGIHCAIQTSGFCDPEIFMAITENLDLVMYDLKIMSPEEHLKFTNCDNSIILKNINMLAKTSCQYIVRLPMIPSITDTPKNLEEIFNFIIKLQNIPTGIEFLQYNSLAPAKYENLGLKYPLHLRTDVCNNALIEKFVRRFTDKGFNCIFRRKDDE